MASNHPSTCNCERCAGIRRYPQAQQCDWCGTRHSGDANNCPDSKYNVNDAVDFDDDPITDELVEQCKRHLRQMTQLVRKHAEATMGLSAKDILKRQAASGEGGSLLHGSDVPKNIKHFKVTITDVREAPSGFNAALILDIKEIYGCTAFALNKTNLIAIADKLGDDIDKWKKKTFDVDIVSTNNPQTKKLTRGLRVSV